MRDYYELSSSKDHYRSLLDGGVQSHSESMSDSGSSSESEFDRGDAAKHVNGIVAGMDKQLLGDVSDSSSDDEINFNTYSSDDEFIPDIMRRKKQPTASPLKKQQQQPVKPLDSKNINAVRKKLSAHKDGAASTPLASSAGTTSPGHALQEEKADSIVGLQRTEFRELKSQGDSSLADMSATSLVGSSSRHPRQPSPIDDRFRSGSPVAPPTNHAPSSSSSPPPPPHPQRRFDKKREDMFSLEKKRRRLSSMNTSVRRQSVTASPIAQGDVQGRSMTPEGNGQQATPTSTSSNAQESLNRLVGSEREQKRAHKGGKGPKATAVSMTSSRKSSVDRTEDSERHSPANSSPPSSTSNTTTAKVGAVEKVKGEKKSGKSSKKQSGGSAKIKKGLLIEANNSISALPWLSSASDSEREREREKEKEGDKKNLPKSEVTQKLSKIKRSKSSKSESSSLAKHNRSTSISVATSELLAEVSKPKSEQPKSKPRPQPPSALISSDGESENDHSLSTTKVSSKPKKKSHSNSKKPSPIHSSLWKENGFLNTSSSSEEESGGSDSDASGGRDWEPNQQSSKAVDRKKNQLSKYAGSATIQKDKSSASSVSRESVEKEREREKSIPSSSSSEENSESDSEDEKVEDTRVGNPASRSRVNSDSSMDIAESADRGSSTKDDGLKSASDVGGGGGHSDGCDSDNEADVEMWTASNLPRGKVTSSSSSVLERPPAQQPASATIGVEPANGEASKHRGIDSVSKKKRKSHESSSKHATLSHSSSSQDEGREELITRKKKVKRKVFSSDSDSDASDVERDSVSAKFLLSKNNKHGGSGARSKDSSSKTSKKSSSGEREKVFDDKRREKERDHSRAEARSKGQFVTERREGSSSAVDRDRKSSTHIDNSRKRPLDKDKTSEADLANKKLRLVDIDFTGGKFRNVPSPFAPGSASSGQKGAKGSSLIKKLRMQSQKHHHGALSHHSLHKTKTSDSSSTHHTIGAREGKKEGSGDVSRKSATNSSTSSPSNVLISKIKSTHSSSSASNSKKSSSHLESSKSAASHKLKDSDLFAQKDAILAAKFPQKRKLISEASTGATGSHGFTSSSLKHHKSDYSSRPSHRH